VRRPCAGTAACHCNDAKRVRFHERVATVNSRQRYAPAPVNMPRCHRDGVAIMPRG
jgi:hypothetical protein